MVGKNHVTAVNNSRFMCMQGQSQVKHVVCSSAITERRYLVFPSPSLFKKYLLQEHFSFFLVKWGAPALSLTVNVMTVPFHKLANLRCWRMLFLPPFLHDICSMCGLLVVRELDTSAKIYKKCLLILNASLFLNVHPETSSQFPWE